MPKAVLEVEYIARRGLVKPLLIAARDSLQLQPLLGRWRNHPLSDLAFAIDTRLDYLPELTRVLDEHVRQLIDNILEASTPLMKFVGQRFALRVTDRRILNRTLISAAVLISESRALFENLADFYTRFLGEAFQEKVDKKSGYEAIARMAKRRRWVRALHEKRQLLLHYRSLWLAFDVDLDRIPLFKPIILFNWRPGSRRAKDTLQVETVHDIQRWLPHVADSMMRRLVRRVKALVRKERERRRLPASGRTRR